jgi:dCTP deaminase
MILSNVVIHRAIDDGLLVISPEPSPRFASLEEPRCPYDTTSVNLRLSKDLSIGISDQPFAFDLKKGSLAPFLKSMFRTCEIDMDGGFTLAPNKFVLGTTVETVDLPIGHASGRALAARVEGRSSLARCGMLVHFTAPTIHAGFRGKITFEIINLGPNPIVLRREMEICQLIFEWVDGMPANALPSQFQNQTTPAGTAS